MPSYNRIIRSDAIGSVEAFSIGEIGGDPAGARRRASTQAGAAPGNPARTAEQGDARAAEAAYRKGMADGRAAAQRETEQVDRALGATLRARVEAIANAVDNEFQTFQQQRADAVLTLAIEIARQLVGDTVRQDSGALLAVIDEALADIAETGGPTSMVVNPVDFDVVATHLSDWIAQRRVSLRADQRIEIGGCRMTNPQTEIDATLSTRWQRTLQAMGRQGEASIAAAIVPEAAASDALAAFAATEQPAQPPLVDELE